MILKSVILVILLTFLTFVSSKSIKLTKFEDDDNNFVVSVNTNGSYSISINNTTWLSSSETFLQANGNFHTNKDNSLILNQTTTSTGEDWLGSWKSTTFLYTIPNDILTTMEASLITYDNLPLIRFQQKFQNGATGTRTNFNSVSSSFPSFLINNIENENVGFLSYGGMMCGDMEKYIGKWNTITTGINDGMQGGPLVLFNQKGDTLVISSMSNFMSSSMQHKQYAGGSINYGVMGGANTITANYSVDFIVYYGNEGINKAMEGWGTALLQYYNKDNSHLKNDFTINNLGYWSDNGAYYYWMTEPNKNYQQTVIDIVNAFNSINIPFKYFQYDSWWYGGPLGTRGGCSKWDAPANVFPDGMKYVYNTINLPASCHNKYWDEKVVYATQNGGSYNFIIDSLTQKSLPNDQSFWNDLMFNASQWGLLTYEQDWLNHQTLDYTPLLTDVDFGRTWLLQMGQAAQKFNITIQYCMSLSRHALQSVEIPSVTQIRVTNDYATNWDYGGEQWRIGISSILASSLGLAPFKDVYWSSESETGNPYGEKATEPYPKLESVISTLSTGPVGPGDKIGSMNRSVIMKCCNDDGLILKPTKAITAIDEQIYAAAFESTVGEVWTTYSQINNYTFGIVLGVDIKNSFYVTPFNCGFDTSDNTVFWRFGDTDHLYPFTNPMSVAALELNKECSKKDFCLYYVAPVFNINGKSVAFLGEVDKWVAVSPQRVEAISVNDIAMIVYVNGAIGEISTFIVAIDNATLSVACQFTTSNSLKISYDGINNLTCN